MTAQEALEYMLQEHDLTECNNMIGTFSASKTGVYFACPGEYPCCHYDMTHEEFLQDYKNAIFEKA